MGIFSIIGLVIKIIFKAPKLIYVAHEVIRLIQKMRETDLAGDLVIVGDILKMLLEAFGLSKEKAINGFIELRDHLKSPNAMESTALNKLQDLRDRLKKEVNSTVAHPSDTKFV